MFLKERGRIVAERTVIEIIGEVGSDEMRFRFATALGGFSLLSLNACEIATAAGSDWGARCDVLADDGRTVDFGRRNGSIVIDTVLRFPNLGEFSIIVERFCESTNRAERVRVNSKT